MKSPHILIIGGGLGGLTLAQSLRKQGISFQVFERDSSDHSRVQGWALSLHWTLEELESKVPKDLGPFEQTSVMRNTSFQDGGSFYKVDGKKIATVGNAPKGQDGYSIRCNRAKLREMMGQHLHIEWNKKFTRYEETENGVTAYFEDGSSASGNMLVGADGWHSRVREQLLQANPVKPLPAPYGIIIGEVTLPKESYQQELENGPSFYIVQGPASHLFVGLKNVSQDQETANYYWLYFWNDRTASELGSEYWTHKATRTELLEYAQNGTKDFDPKLTQLVRTATPGSIMYPPLQLHQWAPYPELPAGRVTILGDAAHPMLPFRGEGANNALLDAVRLGEQVGKYLEGKDKNWVALAKKTYEAEMLPRGADAVMRSGAVGDRAAEEMGRRPDISK